MANEADRTVGADGQAVPSATLPLPSRYRDLGYLGAGSIGEVRRVHDTLLGCTVAMKVLRFEVFDDPDERARFTSEAKLSARLTHPGIISVHDMGELDDGRLWFTMQEVLGQTLEEGLVALHEASSPAEWGVAEGWTFARAIEVLLRVCETVAFAHAEGVLHRDLKPANVLVGSYGEVRVVDWGVAQVRSGPGDDDAPSTPGDRVLGTPAYMPPEQARGQGDQIGPWSDVYGLGAVLYRLLSGAAPYRGAHAVHNLDFGPPPPLLERGGPPVDDVLVQICERAMARDPSDRFQDAGQLSSALSAWREGADRRDRAMALLLEAEAVLATADATHLQAAEGHRLADAALADVQPYDSVDLKLPGWRLQERAAALALKARTEELEANKLARAALAISVGLPAAHQLLADVHRRAHDRAEERSDLAAAQEHLVLLQHHDRGRHREWLAGMGRVSLATDPAGAEVTAHPVLNQDRRCVEGPGHVLGTTPLVEAPLPPGRWVLRIRHPGCEDVRYPVQIGRLEHWHGVAPGEMEPSPILLPALGQWPSDVCYMPAGWFRVGGDAKATDPVAARRLWADGFIASKHPVTNAEYLTFLRSLPLDEALGHVPYRRRNDNLEEPWPFDAHFRLDEAMLNLPVVRLTSEDAQRYCAWRAERDGVPWRLPHDLEWEKAARGVSGRALPWGDFFDPTWCQCLLTSSQAPSIGAVGGRPEDVSVYGLFGMAGNVRDWTGSTYSRGGLDPDVQRVPGGLPRAEVGALLVCRGGAWPSSADVCRPAGRFAAPTGSRNNALGFRLFAGLQTHRVDR